MVEQIIVNKILDIQKNNQSVIIAFCGAADLGKSFMANKVAQLLNEANIESNHLTLDSFLMDRAERKKNKISGYDIRAHDTKQILSTLEDWAKGQGIRFQPYDHHTGTKSNTYLSIKHSKVLLIEGLFSMYKPFLPFINLSFFFYTNDTKLREIKLAADLTKRNYTPEYSKKIYDGEFKLYKKNIEPFKEAADFKIYLKEKWHYNFE